MGGGQENLGGDNIFEMGTAIFSIGVDGQPMAFIHLQSQSLGFV